MAENISLARSLTSRQGSWYVRHLCSAPAVLRTWILQASVAYSHQTTQISCIVSMLRISAGTPLSLTRMPQLQAARVQHSQQLGAYALANILSEDAGLPMVALGVHVSP